jgi:hypothetical protein
LIFFLRPIMFSNPPLNTGGGLHSPENIKKWSVYRLL